MNNPRSPLLHDHKPQTSSTAMINLNATTPQLKAVKNLIEAYVNNTESPASKDYKYQTFPKVAELHDEEKGGHFERYAVLFSLMTKVEVCTQHPIRARRLIFIIPRSMFTRQLKHQERLFSTFVPPYTSVTPSQIITCNNGRSCRPCATPSTAMSSITILSASSPLLRRMGNPRSSTSRISRIQRSVENSMVGLPRLLQSRHRRSTGYTCVKRNCEFEQSMYNNVTILERFLRNR